MSVGEDSFDLASVDQVLATARSVRRNLDFDRAVEPGVLRECIDLATQAPVGINGESWRFLVVTDPGQKGVIAGLYREVLHDLMGSRDLPIKPTQQALVDRLHEVPALLFVCTQGPPPGETIGEQVAFYGSVLPAAWSLMLALRARQLGATWTTLLSTRQAEVGDLLQMPGDVIQTVMLPVGYLKGATMRRAARLPAAEVMFWNHWGSATEPVAG